MNKINQQEVIKDETDNTILIQKNNTSFHVNAFFIDLDGTALDAKRRKIISEENIEAIKETNKTTPVIISTGRSYGDKVKNLMNILGTKYAICQNGSIVADSDGNILLDIALSPEQVDKVVAVAKKYRLGFNINSQFIIYANSPLLFFPRLFSSKFKNQKKFQNNIRVNKIVLAGKLKRKMFKIYNQIKNELDGVSMKITAHDLAIEITNESATKGTGTKFVANLLNIKPSESVHVGDSQNDTTTLDVVGALVAMENSSKHLLDVATHIGPNYKKGGLAKVLRGEFKKINR